MVRVFFAFPLLLLVLSGCSESSALVPVEGVVTLNGAPLPNATVALLPLTATGSGPYSGVTEADGKFSLGLADSPRGGAAANEYYVNITTVADTTGGIETAKPAPTQKEVVPMAYRDSTTKFTVPAEGTTAANFDLKSK